jgi:hypothetical protein
LSYPRRPHELEALGTAELDDAKAVLWFVDIEDEVVMLLVLVLVLRLLLLD